MLGCSVSIGVAFGFHAVGDGSLTPPIVVPLLTFKLSVDSLQFDNAAAIEFSNFIALGAWVFLGEH